MKKLILFGVFMFTLTITSFGQFKFGAGVSIDIGDFFGVTGKAHYTVNDEFAGQASFTYFFESNATVWALDLDVLYDGFEIGDLEGFKLTPFAGLQVGSISVDVGFGSVGNTEVGINLGIQGLIPITESLDLWIEPKFVIGGLEGVYISGGIYF